MPNFATKMLTARAVAKGEKDKREAAKELGVAVGTVETWVRSYKTAALQDYIGKGKGETKEAPAKPRTKPALPEPQQPTKPTAAPVVKPKEEEEEWDII